MKRVAAAVLSAGLMVACGGAQDADEPARPVVAPPPLPAPDPRIAEMQVMLGELLDRVEVLSARVEEMEEGRAERAAPRSQQAPSQPATRPAQQPVRSTPAASSGRPVGELYREGLALWAKGRLDEARAAFAEVLDRDPTGDLADNAVYWTGEAHYVQARYNDAIEQYRRVIQDYPDHNKAPDAMFKMGLAYARLGDLTLARSTLEQLIERYPYSTPAAAARTEIQKLKY